MVRVKRSVKRKPTHPGAILREDVLPEINITRNEFAKCLGLSRYMVSEILHERKSITPDIAIRLSRFLGTTSMCWLNMQRTVDIWKLEASKLSIYESIKKFS